MSPGEKAQSRETRRSRGIGVGAEFRLNPAAETAEVSAVKSDCRFQAQRKSRAGMAQVRRRVAVVLPMRRWRIFMWP